MGAAGKHRQFSQASPLPVSDLLLADSAGLLVCDDTFDLLVENSFLLHLKNQSESPDIAADAVKTFHLKINIFKVVFFFNTYGLSEKLFIKSPGDVQGSP